MFSEKLEEKFFLNLFWGVVLSLLFNIIVIYTDIGRTCLNNVYDYLVVRDFKNALEASEKSGEIPIDNRIRLVLFDKDVYEASDSQGFWTPRDLVGEAVLKTVSLGAKVVVADFDWSRPAPIFSKGKDENQEFLNFLEQAAEAARGKGSVIILPHPEITQNTGTYKQDFENLLDKYKDVIKQGTPGAFEDTTDYQVRHFRFYERTEQNRIYFSLQILAAAYLWHGQKEGDEIITKAKNQIRRGDKKIAMNTEKPIRIYPQNDLNREYLDARYLFRFAQREIIARHGYKQDPCVRYADSDLCLSPYELPGAGDIYKGKAVIIGSTNPDTNSL